jgi:hypothetical protein
MFTKLSPSVIRVASRRLRRPMTALLCPFLLRRERVLCRTVREADSRPHRSCSDCRSSVPLLPVLSQTRAQRRDLCERSV